MYNTTEVSNVYGNTGKQNLTEDYGKFRKGVLVPIDAEFATKVAALTKQTWIDNLNAAVGSRWYLFEVVNVEPTQEENVKFTTDFGFEYPVRPGKTTKKIMFPPMHVHNKNELAKLDAKSFAIFEISDTDFISGHSPDKIKLLPFALDYFSVLPEVEKSGSEPALVYAEFRYTDSAEKNRYEVKLNPNTDAESTTPWRPSIELSSVKDLVITVSDFHAASVKITLKGYDGTPYRAAVAGDVYMRKTTVTGTAIPLVDLDESATPGVYDAVFAGQTSGTFYFSLYDQPDATTQGVETPEYTSIVATIS